MAENRSRGNDVLQQLSRLSDEHEIILLKRLAITQMQKNKTLENKSRLAPVLCFVVFLTLDCILC